MKSIGFYIISLLLLSAGLHAQQGAPVAWSLNYLPANKESEPRLLNTQLLLNIPTYKDSSITGLFGASFRYYGFNFQNDSLNIQNLYSCSFPVTFQIKTSINKYFVLMMEPIISSDLKSINNSDLRYNFAIFYLNKNAQNTSGLGIAVSKRFSGFQLAPLWIVNYRLGKKWIFAGTIPFKSKIAYEINNKKQIGINFGANTNSFRLSENGEGCYLDYQTIETYLFYQQSVSKCFKLNVGVGAQSLQTDVYNNNQATPLGIFLLYPNSPKNLVESFRSKGMFLLQMGISFSPQ